MDVNMVLNALEETITEVGIHESIADKFDQDTTLSKYT
ncbi:hypothetical protein ATJ93_4764 [Halopiger aswanensis]|uniref:Uncharacterized protein n=2 Tax=Halopiger aswanensis TaxID=148449 RepID=A0A419VUK6_9EURY|nr:hypothetical protein ATJ93_4764 [Halopiger aswanensis]